MVGRILIIGALPHSLRRNPYESNMNELINEENEVKKEINL
jgi:hypothetical protein